MIKAIKNKTDYQAALKHIEALLIEDPDVGTKKSDNLEVLSILIEKYESELFPMTMPDPIAAIAFRMEQHELSQRDLIPYIGSRSKVSEVLSKKRPLTLKMIRALEAGLGIPAKALLKDSEEDQKIDWAKFPIVTMAKRGWIQATSSQMKNNTYQILQRFFEPIGSPLELIGMHKKTDHIRSARSIDKYALAAWTARIFNIAKKQKAVSFLKGTVNLEFMRQVVRLSKFDDGPKKAQDFLIKHGISLVVEQHLPSTHLDGAAIMLDLNHPVIGLTIRYDRIDNFWFCLMHELAHIALHFGQGVRLFYDNLDVSPHDDEREKKADALAGEALVPTNEWAKSPASRTRMEVAVENLAKKLDIHVAIVAGKMRYEFKSYRLFNNLVGSGEIRKHFKEVKWE